LSHPGERWWVGLVNVLEKGESLGKLKLSGFTSLARFLGRGETLYQPGVFWHREMLEGVPSFDTALHFVFDHEYWVRCLLHGYRPVNIDAALANFRLHPHSKTSRSQCLFMNELWQVARRNRSALPKEKWVELCRHLQDYEAGYLIDTVYSLLSQKQRTKALGYLLKNVRLAGKLPSRRLYFGALARILFKGSPPSWFERR
jgi:hypothetical protein